MGLRLGVAENEAVDPSDTASGVGPTAGCGATTDVSWGAAIRMASREAGGSTPEFKWKNVVMPVE